jgi:hypothetical protein
LLSSPYGNGCVFALLDAIESGQTVLINMADGTVFTITEKRDAIHVLHESFGWKGEG